MSNLPLEIVSEILQIILEANEVQTGNGRANTKPPWNLVSSLSLTSKMYRDLVLRAWFRRLYTENFRDTMELTERIPQAKKSWVRQLHCVNPTSSSRHKSSWDLKGYSQLELVRLDWSPNWNPYSGDSRESSDYLPFVNTPQTVITFDFRSIRWPYPTAYLFIQQCFPLIRKLVLHQQKIWCNLCFTVNRVSFAAPIPRCLVYEGDLGLPTHYAKALKSLELLERISINTVAFHFGFARASQTQNEYLWTGECDSCMRLFFTDSRFTSAYVSRKKRGVVQSVDGTEHEMPRPPSLRSVEWIFTPVTAGNDVILDPHDEPDMNTDPESEEVDYEDEDEGDS